MLTETEAWQKFNLGDQNQDPGGSWLYAMRYSAENLQTHQATLVSQIKNMGIDIFMSKDERLGLGSDGSGLFDDEMLEKLGILAEELTVTNEALEHARIELYNRDTSYLCELYITTFAGALATGDTVAASTLLRNEMPGFVSDISRAQFDNEPLTAPDFEAVQRLGEFAAKHTAALLDGGVTFSIDGNGEINILTATDLPEPI